MIVWENRLDQKGKLLLKFRNVSRTWVIWLQVPRYAWPWLFSISWLDLYSESTWQNEKQNLRENKNAGDSVTPVAMRTLVSRTWKCRNSRLEKSSKAKVVLCSLLAIVLPGSLKLTQLLFSVLRQKVPLSVRVSAGIWSHPETTRKNSAHHSTRAGNTKCGSMGRTSVGKNNPDEKFCHFHILRMILDHSWLPSAWHIQKPVWGHSVWWKPNSPWYASTLYYEDFVLRRVFFFH